MNKVAPMTCTTAPNSSKKSVFGEPYILLGIFSNNSLTFLGRSSKSTSPEIEPKSKHAYEQPSQEHAQLSTRLSELEAHITTALSTLDQKADEDAVVRFIAEYKTKLATLQSELDRQREDPDKIRKLQERFEDLRRKLEVVIQDTLAGFTEQKDAIKQGHAACGEKLGQYKSEVEKRVLQLAARRKADKVLWWEKFNSKWEGRFQAAVEASETRLRAASEEMLQLFGERLGARERDIENSITELKSVKESLLENEGFRRRTEMHIQRVEEDHNVTAVIALLVALVVLCWFVVDKYPEHVGMRRSHRDL